ncbi:MAG: nickel ABC transporter substrate-binding protein [Tumebacillaceae bacterium]
MISLISMLLLSGAVVASGCTDNSQQTNADASGTEAKTVTILYHFKSPTLDPHNDWGPMRTGVTETLVRLDDNLQLQPWLASKWETQDNKKWVFTIRDGITFHDGTKLDAAAVKASLERAITVSKPMALALKIASVEASGQTLTIVTSGPHPTLPSELVNPNASIVSVEAEKKMGTEAFNNDPVGTGPFMVKSFTSNTEIVLERNEKYWDGKAKLRDVVVKFNDDANVRALSLQSKEADIATQLPSEMLSAIAQDEDLEVKSVPSLRVHYLIFNQQKPLLQDVRVRKALDMLLDRDSMAEKVMLGNATPANGPFSTSLPFASQDAVQKIDMDGAKKLLAEAGFQPGADGKLAKDGKPLTLELITYKLRPELPLLAQLFQSDAAKAGITVNIKTVENAETYLRENKDYDLVTYSSLSAPRGDGEYFLDSALMPGGSVNSANINSKKIIDIVARLNVTSNAAQRNELTKEAVSIIKEEVPHAYAVYPNLIVGVNKRVANWKPRADEHYIVTKELDVK